MGPAPQPTAIKRARGNPGKRKLNDKEPQPMVGLPAFPDHLPDEARPLWDKLGSDLVRTGVMTELDGQAFADLIETEMLNQRLSLALVGQVPVEDQRKNPLWMLKLDYLRERRAQHANFGMTPAARSKIVSAGQDIDPLEAALH